MTRATLNALAYLHCTGCYPQFLRTHTRLAMLPYVESVKGEITIGDITLPSYTEVLKDPALVENHPMVRKIAELAADGWKPVRERNKLGRRRVRSGVPIERLGTDRLESRAVYPDGMVSRF